MLPFLSLGAYQNLYYIMLFSIWQPANGVITLVYVAPYRRYTVRMLLKLVPFVTVQDRRASLVCAKKMLLAPPKNSMLSIIASTHVAAK